MAKNRPMTTKELHEHMKKPRCFHCGRVKEDHVHTVSGKILCALGPATGESEWKEVDKPNGFR